MFRFILASVLLSLAISARPVRAGEADPLRTKPEGVPEVLVKRLPNGLTVVIRELHGAPVVALRAYVKYTGRIWEGRFNGAGIAHNLEHLVAGGTTTTRSEDESDAIKRSIGGSDNAYTTLDHTGYFINTAASSFDAALGLLSDWLMNCTLKPEEIARERETITEEIARAKDNWIRAAYEAYGRAMFGDHPITVPTLGHLETFRKITREDLLAYYRERYIPQNVIFVVVGDVKTKEALGKVSKAFGGWKPGREGVHTLPPVRRAGGMKWAETTHPAARTCIVYAGFPSIELNHPDMYPLDVLALVLSRGRASRLNARIVEKEKLAARVGAWSDTPSYGCGTFTAYLMGLPYKNVKPGVEAILEEIDRCKTEPIGREELERAKTQVIAALVFRRQTAEDIAEDLGGNVKGLGDPYFSERYLERIRKVTWDQVMDVARRYFDRDKLVVCVMRPPGRAARAETKEAVPAAEGEGATLKLTLKNGLRVLIRRNAQSPIVSMQAWCRAGLAAEPEGKNGINNLTATLLTHGTASRTQLEIHRLLEGVGGSIEASGGNNTYGIKIDVLEEGMDTAFDLFADVLLRSSFPAEEVAKAKMMTIRQIMQKRADADEEAIRIYRSRYFRTHPYRRKQEGTPKEIQGITRDDIASYHKRWFVPSNAVVSIFGDFKVEKAKALAEKYFSGLVQPEGFEPVKPGTEAPREAREDAEVKSNFGNVHILVGYPAPLMTAPDRFAMTLMNIVVSRGDGNWVFEALRGKEEGLVYSAYGSFWAGIGASTYYVSAQTATKKADRVLSLILEQLKKALNGISEKELHDAKNACVVGEMLYKQTLSGQAQWAALCELYGQGYDFPKKYLGLIEKVTLDDVKRVANTYLKNPLILRIVPKGKKG